VWHMQDEEAFAVHSTMQNGSYRVSRRIDAPGSTPALSNSRECLAPPCSGMVKCCVQSEARKRLCSECNCNSLDVCKYVEQHSGRLSSERRDCLHHFRPAARSLTYGCACRPLYRA
jgi:hypothetical protein